MRVIFLILILGCTTVNEGIDITSTVSKDRVLGESIRNLDVPFYKQPEYQCGPVSLASVINYWNKMSNMPEVSVEEIIGSIYSSGARGVLGIDLELYARKKGFYTFQRRGSTEKLKELVDKGIPSIILVSYGFSVVQLDHFMVVKGYNEKGIITNGKRPNEFISYKELNRIWKRAGYWMLVITPPGILSSTFSLLD